MGDFLSRAASRAATTVEDEVTFYWEGQSDFFEVRDRLTMAGIANSFSCAYLKRAARLSVGLYRVEIVETVPRTSSPTITPDLRESTSVAPMFAVERVVGIAIAMSVQQQVSYLIGCKCFRR